jgi:hypothetical protein
MSIKAVAIPLLSAGAAVVLFNLLAGRRESATRRAMVGGTKTGGDREPVRRVPGPRRANAEAALQAHLPGEVTLPTAFWDAMAPDQVDSSRHLAFAEELGDSTEPQDLETTWARRNLHSFEVMSEDYVDDPAEIAADSISMISEASRAAARNPADRDEESEEDRL